jgi:hypothetical protein
MKVLGIKEPLVALKLVTMVIIVDYIHCSELKFRESACF